MAIHFEDFSDGQVIEGAPITVSRDAMIAFANAFDPQPFHLDEEAAKATLAGRLIGSGWLTAALGMRLLHRDGFSGCTSMGAPGVTELRWLRPLLPGASLRLHLVVEATRVSASKPDRGFVQFRMTLLGEGDTPNMAQAFTGIFARRGADPPPPCAVVHQSFDEPLKENEDTEPIRFLGDTPIGTVRRLGAHRFDAASIVAFAAAYDPQAMHVDPEAAARTHFGGLCASGWHTAAVWMKRLHATLARDARLTRVSGSVPQLGPSPGFRDLRWLRPVYAGDTVSYSSRLIETRKSNSRQGWGIATHHNTGTNQRGEPVFEFTGSVFQQWASAPP